MAQPDGFSDTANLNYVCKLQRSLYRLKQLTRIRNKTIDDFMLRLEFKKSESNHCVYMKRDSQNMIFVALYVDDLILASSTSKMIQETKQVSDRFKITNIGQFKYFLGIEIEQDFGIGTLTMRQIKFACDILVKFNMENCKAVRMPQDIELKLTKCEGGFKHTETMVGVPYQNAVGCSMYLMVGTRLDLAVTIGVLSQFAADLCPTHWESLKRVFRYIQGTRTHGIEF